MGFWRGRGKEPPEKPAPVQLRPADRHPFSLIDGYVPLHQPEFSLYRAIREAVPVVDAAVLKLVRLAGGVGVTCQDKEAERALNHFLRTVPVGWNQKGIQAFLDSYLDCLLTCGRAVGEIVPSRDGRDFVAVGDVEIKVIGAECAIPDCQAPVRMILEQLIAQTGIPPFLLGLNWSSTERMSSQQADIMTSELAALRRTLTPVVEKICTLWLRMHGKDCAFQVEWEEIDLQDQVEEARAALYRQQAEQMARESRDQERQQEKEEAYADSDQGGPGPGENSPRGGGAGHREPEKRHQPDGGGGLSLYRAPVR